MRRLKDYILIFVKGLGMGAADVVPGVSGGTVAFITGIYEELLDSIKSVDKEALQLLIKFDFKQFWKKVNGNFLLALFLGIITSLITLSRVISYHLKEHPIYVWSFFFGLIVISAIIVLKEVGKWSMPVVLSCIVGAVIAYLVTVLTPAETPDGLWFVFLAGAVAICAMILPGISGAFILLVMGKYEFVVNALNEKDISVIVVFALGCATGLLTFSRAISWVLKKYHNLAVALLAGFMIGALNKVWPWKEVVLYRINDHGEQVPAFDKSVLPKVYLEVTGNNPQVLQAVLFMALGILFVVVIERVANYGKTNR